MKLSVQNLNKEKAVLQVQGRLPTPTPYHFVGPPKWETLNCPAGQEPRGPGRASSYSKKGALLLPPSSLTLGGCSGWEQAQNPSQILGVRGTRERSARKPGPRGPSALPPTCPSRPASWQPPRLSLLARSPPGARSTSSSPRSRPPGHSPPRTPSRA